MKIYIKSAELGFEVISDIYNKRIISDDRLSKYYNSTGIDFLKKHLLKTSKFNLEEDYFKKQFVSLSDSNIFGKSIQSGIKLFNNYNIQISSFVKDSQIIATEMKTISSKMSINILL